MKQFTQLLVLILLSTNLHLSASGFHRNDTIDKFNEVTDIELLLKAISDTTRTSEIAESEFQDTIRAAKIDSLKRSIDRDFVLTPIEQDSIMVPIKTDSAIVDKALVMPKDESIFTPIVIRTSLDSLYSRKSNGTIELPEQSEVSYDSYISMLNFRDTMLYNPLYLPVVFTGRIEDPDSAFIYPDRDERLKGTLVSADDTFNQLAEEQSFADKVRRDYFLENPTDIKLATAKLSGVKRAATDTEVREKFNPFKELLSSQTSFSLDKPDVEGIKIDRVYWVKNGDHSLQFSQNYFSPNWHRGGTSNLNINSNHIFNVNYQKDKIKFNNRFEWRLSVYNAPDDTLRNYRIGNDLIRYYGDFGLDAFLKSWSYSTNLEAKTQMFKSYQANKDELRSSFLAPLYVNAGIGMKYHLDKRSKTVRHRRVRLDVSISPLSVNYRYVGNDDVNRKRYGIPEGDKSLLDKGSTLVSNMTYDFTKYVSWRSRIKYFTNYSKSEAEFENTLTMSLTQLFSTTINLNLRFDDGVPADDDYKYLQVNEVISFGLNYKW